MSHRFLCQLCLIDFILGVFWVVVEAMPSKIKIRGWEGLYLLIGERQTRTLAELAEELLRGVKGVRGGGFSYYIKYVYEIYFIKFYQKYFI